MCFKCIIGLGFLEYTSLCMTLIPVSVQGVPSASTKSILCLGILTVTAVDLLF